MVERKFVASELIEFVKGNKRESTIMTRIELANEVGITDNGIKKIITNLKSAGWIIRLGSNKSGYWDVTYNFE